jgi:hypothetical protein
MHGVAALLHHSLQPRCICWHWSIGEHLVTRLVDGFTVGAGPGSLRANIRSVLERLFVKGEEVPIIGMFRCVGTCDEVVGGLQPRSRACLSSCGCTQGFGHGTLPGGGGE